MLEKIKSQYFIKLIFSFINETGKLILVKYNKRIQNIININLINYKVLSGKYIIIETNEKGKEFKSYNNELIFEGEYLNKKRNGAGKEYYNNGNILFEGEYLEGKRNGKGREYD